VDEEAANVLWRVSAVQVWLFTLCYITLCYITLNCSNSQGLTGQWLQGSPVFDQPIPMETIPCTKYESLVLYFSKFIFIIAKVYAIDILRWLPEILATCTSSFGSILKIDSTKICRKLQGRAAGSASWCTNVRNEWDEVLTSVLTESEGLDGLCPMSVGLIQR